MLYSVAPPNALGATDGRPLAGPSAERHMRQLTKRLHEVLSGFDALEHELKGAKSEKHEALDALRTRVAGYRVAYALAFISAGPVLLSNVETDALGAPEIPSKLELALCTAEQLDRLESGYKRVANELVGAREQLDKGMALKGTVPLLGGGPDPSPKTGYGEWTDSFVKALRGQLDVVTARINGIDEYPSDFESREQRLIATVWKVRSEGVVVDVRRSSTPFSPASAVGRRPSARRTTRARGLRIRHRGRTTIFFVTSCSTSWMR